MEPNWNHMSLGSAEIFWKPHGGVWKRTKIIRYIFKLLILLKMFYINTSKMTKIKYLKQKYTNTTKKLKFINYY